MDKLAYFGKNNIFYIKPSSGQIYKLEVASFKGLKGKTISGFTTIENGGYSYLCAELTDGSLVKLYNYTTKNFCGALTKQGKPRKKSEGGMGWLSFCLGEDIDPTTKKQSAFHMLNHTIVAISIYGLDVMKYAVMDFLSIFTIDHINGIHDDNRPENLRLVTTDANAKLEHNKAVLPFDFLKYWSTAIKAGYRNQENLDFRKTVMS